MPSVDPVGWPLPRSLPCVSRGPWRQATVPSLWLPVELLLIGHDCACEVQAGWAAIIHSDFLHLVLEALSVPGVSSVPLTSSL